ncbi:MAG: type II secretion system protein [Limisphaerales bacterium]
MSLRRFHAGVLPPLKSFRDIRARRGVTLIELLCVLVILGILASLLLPALLGAYNRARALEDEWNAEAVLEMLQKEIRGYCAAHAQYNFNDKYELADKCGIAPKCRDWIDFPLTEFTPFTYLDPTNKIVLTFHVGRKHATVYSFQKWELTEPRPN